VNGEQAAQTDANGRFRIGRVPVGPANVSFDASQLETGLSPVGDPSKDLVIEPRQTAHVEFQVARFSTFAGSLVVCDGERRRAGGGARLALIHGEIAISLDVTASGGFQTDQVPPGEYAIVIDPTSIPGHATDLPRLHVDLRSDLLGYVIGIGCPDSVLAAGRRPAPVTSVPNKEAEAAPALPIPAPVPAPTAEALPVPEKAAVPTIVPAAEPETTPAPHREQTLLLATRLVQDERFREALDAFSNIAPVTEARYRFPFAVALYETGHYAEAKREIAVAEIPDSDDAKRYVAKIEGAIVP
jgi:hypothetical protein